MKAADLGLRPKIMPDHLRMSEGGGKPVLGIGLLPAHNSWYLYIEEGTLTTSLAWFLGEDEALRAIKFLESTIGAHVTGRREP